MLCVIRSILVVRFFANASQKSTHTPSHAAAVIGLQLCKWTTEMFLITDQTGELCTASRWNGIITDGVHQISGRRKAISNRFCPMLPHVMNKSGASKRLVENSRRHGKISIQCSIRGKVNTHRRTGRKSSIYPQSRAISMQCKPQFSLWCYYRME